MSHMKVKSPLKRKYETEMLIEAGADELYCGVCYRGRSSCGEVRPTESNVPTMQELKEIIQVSKSYHVPVSLTLNSRFGFNYETVARIAEKAASVGIKSFIVRDIVVLHMLSKLNLGVDVHLSCLASSFNSESIRFYKEYGIKRVTLPRQLTIKEIECISKRVAGVDLEVMIYNSKCKNENGFCRINHPFHLKHCLFATKKRKEMNHDSGLLNDLASEKGIKDYCSMINLTKNSSYKQTPCCADYYSIEYGGNPRFKLNNEAFHGYFSKDVRISCGLCAIYPLAGIGIKTIKVEGRPASLVKKFHDTRLVKNAVNFLKKVKNKRQFEEGVKRMQYDATGSLVCDKENCFYQTRPYV